MRQVKAKPLKDYFIKEPDPDLWLAPPTPFHIAKIHWFHPLMIWVAVGITSLLMSFKHDYFFMLSLSVFIFLYYTYVSARSLARGLFISRTVYDKQFIEGQKLKVTIDVKNASSFALSNYKIFDHFGPQQKSSIQIVAENSLPARTQRVEHYEGFCDGGMGKKNVGPLKLTFTDPLGIFQFEVTEDDVLEVHVYPKINPLPDTPILPAPQREEYGSYESFKTGHNVNFSGIRPYAPGDSLRHIAWKVSARVGHLQVKEFEKTINCDATLAINMDPQVHVGQKVMSTWEHAKDLALSLVALNLEQGHTLALHSNQLYVEPGKGEQHLHLISHQLTKMRDLDDPQSEDDSLVLNTEQFLNSLRLHLSQGSMLIYISPLDARHLATTKKTLKELRLRQVSIMAVFIDPSSFIRSVAPVVRSELPPNVHSLSSDQWTSLVHDLRALGVLTYIANADIEVSQTFLARSEAL